MWLTGLKLKHQLTNKHRRPPILIFRHAESELPARASSTILTSISIRGICITMNMRGKGDNEGERERLTEREREGDRERD